ncbi:MAG: oligosaccharide flippase family protein, partial [Paludibacteraceae bacterium]|nr:oligosaccharide flippase family protein [Paludibacteraceae bacterium]
MIDALKWSAVDRTLQQGVQFVIGIVLARLLCPEDYGLIGMIMIFAQ